MVLAIPPIQQTGNAPVGLTETGSPTINISETNREGITRVLFSRDPLLLEYLANTFFDSHTEADESGNLSGMIPNTSIYKCNFHGCGLEFNRNMALRGTYKYCNGTQKRPHPITQTTPVNWNPILTSTGIYTLLGQTGAAMNTNIATANFGKISNDMKSNLTLDDRLMHSSYALALGMLATLIGNPNMYINPKLMKDKTIHQVFTASFDMSFLINMTYNIMSNFTKGKHMEAVKVGAENRIRTESEVQHKWDYPVQAQMHESKSLREKLGDVMGR